MSMNETLREAGPADADRIAALVNRAFLAESWFKSVDRTNASQVRHLLGKGVVLAARRGLAIAGLRLS